jgi:Prophage CP4-57 regulatory protein (AlpA)
MVRSVYQNGTASAPPKPLVQNPGSTSALTQFDELVATNQFPQPIKLSDSGRAVAWLRSDLDQWLEERVAKRDSPEAKAERAQKAKATLAKAKAKAEAKAAEAKAAETAAPEAKRKKQKSGARA